MKKEQFLFHLQDIDDDFEKYLYVSEDYGKTWKSIAGNLPSEPINVIREDPKCKDIFYVGTEPGVYVSIDRGKTWFSLCGNLPTTPVHDMIVHPRDDELVIGTHGRSVYVLEVRIIQKFVKEKIFEKEIYLFDLKPAEVVSARGILRAEASIYFYLKIPQSVEIEVLDKNGKSIKKSEFKGEEGINLSVISLTSEIEYVLEPGDYKLVISAGEKKVEGTLKLIFVQQRFEE